MYFALCQFVEFECKRFEACCVKLLSYIVLCSIHTNSSVFEGFYLSSACHSFESVVKMKVSVEH
jgi:hypothetical protein